jgi:hypothetical protein
MTEMRQAHKIEMQKNWKRLDGKLRGGMDPRHEISSIPNTRSFGPARE